jgi:chorismate synthase
MNDFAIRELQGVEELALTEKLNRAVWGEDDPTDDKDLLRAIQDEGGLIAGAFTIDRQLAAYLFAFPTRDPRIQHSHKLGVHPTYQAHGLGLTLKWFQRTWCLKRGIQLVRWTYDPLRSINAHLNIHKLGATANSYKENYYGSMVGINAGAPSDRFVAEWYLNEPRVVRRAQNQAETPLARASPANSVIDEKPVAIYFDLEGEVAVQIPRNFSSLISQNQELAKRWRQHSREVFGHYFTRGFRLTNFLRDQNTYILERLPLPRLG